MKHNLRRRMRSMLRAIGPEERRARSDAACRRLMAEPEWLGAGTVFVYLATSHEMDTTPLVDAGWSQRRRVVAPRVDPRDHSIHPIEIVDWTDCLPGFRGILEPITDRVVQPDQIDLIVMPGLAFDVEGRRLGQGGGYFDRFLARFGGHGRACGFAFEAQYLTQVPTESHDRGVDLLVSETSVRRFGGPPVSGG